MGARTRGLAVVAAGLLAFATACGGSGSSGGGSGNGSGGGGANAAPVKVGLVYAKTGLLAGYGKEYEQGFTAGLDYATHGTGAVSGHKIEVTERDGASDPTKAVSAAKELIGQGTKILAGGVSSAVSAQLAPLADQNNVLFVSGPAATDAVTGINNHTFRSGRETYQDVKTAASIVGDIKSKKVLVFAQDYEFGQANVAAVQAVLGGAGASVDKLLVPLSANDFTPYAQQIKQRKPDLLFVAWAGDTTSSMWKTLDQQGVFGATKVVTGLGDSASFSAYGSAATKIQFLSYYFPSASNSDVNKQMVQLVKKHGGQADLFTPDGFVAAQMIVHAIQASGGDDVRKMVSALAGWQFDGPKGQETVRAQDHALLQPMYVAKLTQSGSILTPQLVTTVPADQVAPPVKSTGQS